TDDAELELDAAALGDLRGPPKRVRVLAEVGGHLVRALEEELLCLEAPVARVLERVVRLDAEQDLVGACVLAPEVVDDTRGDERQLRRLGEALELRVDARLLGQPRVLDLDVDLVVPENLDETVEVGSGVGGPALLERLRDPAGQAAREGDQPG